MPLNAHHTSEEAHLTAEAYRSKWGLDKSQWNIQVDGCPIVGEYEYVWHLQCQMDGLTVYVHPSPRGHSVSIRGDKIRRTYALSVISPQEALTELWGKLRALSLHLCDLRDKVGDLLLSPSEASDSDEGDVWSLLREGG